MCLTLRPTTALKKQSSAESERASRAEEESGTEVRKQITSAVKTTRRRRSLCGRRVTFHLYFQRAKNTKVKWGRRNQVWPAHTHTHTHTGNTPAGAGRELVLLWETSMLTSLPVSAFLDWFYRSENKHPPSEDRSRPVICHWALNVPWWFYFSWEKSLWCFIKRILLKFTLRVWRLFDRASADF